ncbi:hypothetical protein [Burkholderia multivorans]|uniref:hypothetical protein n=1 Tax=Burkholderia multivorans TaxID=87883 RepID=UPI0015E2AD53|nr:hypothetical protein [Burkholderia multivorans]
MRFDDWKQDSEYGWSHPSGWNIGRYIVNGTPVFMLWHGGVSSTLKMTQRQHIGFDPPG